MAKQNVKLQPDLIELSDADLMAVVGGGLVGDATQGALALQEGALNDSPTEFLIKSEQGLSNTAQGVVGAAV